MWRIFETDVVPSSTRGSASETAFLPRITWGVFLCVLLGALLITAGAPTGLTFLLGSAVAILLAWRYPYIGLYLFIITAPLLGVVVSISTGRIEFGERTFGGSIDVVLAELIAGAVLAAWALRLFFIRQKRERPWMPWLPLIEPYTALVAAHILSALSIALPDPILVLKYSLRPVFFAYISSVILPVNFIRSRQRLLTVFLLMGIVGLVFTLDGFRSLFSWSGGEGFLYRARPLPILGFAPIGINHNVLAELLLTTFPFVLAWGILAKDIVRERWAAYAALGMAAVAVLTFARSAWITLAIQLLFLGCTIWRETLKKYWKTVLKAGLLATPVILYMLILSLSPGVQGSTDARSMLSGVALELFHGSPLIGVGAGTFVDRVSHTWIFTYEFGNAMDSHGIFQKVLAETGILGFVALLAVIAVLIRLLYTTWMGLRRGSDDWQAFTLCIAAVLGAWTYQVFNTTYWTPKLWLPIGLALAAGRIFLARQAARDPDFLSSSHV